MTRCLAFDEILYESQRNQDIMASDIRSGYKSLLFIIEGAINIECQICLCLPSVKKLCYNFKHQKLRKYV